MLVCQANCCEKGKKFIKWNIAYDDSGQRYRGYSCVFVENRRIFCEDISYCPFCGKEWRDKDGIIQILDRSVSFTELKEPSEALTNDIVIYYPITKES